MIYFVSDVHLGLESRDKDRIREQKFINFLDAIADSCEVLYIVGDLYDFWFEYRRVMPKIFFRTISKLYDLRQRNIKIEYVMGNHDFGHKDFFKNELDIDVYKDDIIRSHYGKTFYISHGDGKSYNDLGYIILKKILRCHLSLFLYNNFIHPDLGIRLASHSSKTSRLHTETKNYGNRDGMYDFAVKQIEKGCDYVIMGHRHELAHKKAGKGEYINLGSWLQTPHVGMFDGNSFILEPVDNIIDTK
jgi:UDP-2,3-diacylglucosamine hydrolase